MRRLILVEPTDPGPAWAPFSGARPIAELRVGAFKLWERWNRLLPSSEVQVLSPTTPLHADVDSIPLASPGPIRGPAIVAQSTFAPVGTELNLPAGVEGLRAGGQTVAWVVGPGETWTGPTEPKRVTEIKGLALGGTTDLITACERLLEADCVSLAEDASGVPAGSVVIGDPSLVIAKTASIEPHVVFDVRKGPIVLEPDSVVRAGARLEGPLYLGSHSWILGGAVRHSSIGPHCRVHGEVSTSVFLGYANKSHDGFVGHSVIGQWVNLGAGTITSNLKNTYGPVRLELPTGRLETGRTNVGTLFGDHAKAGIGCLFSTGSVIGVGANVIGPATARYERPFAWAGPRLQTLEGFLAVAGRVMPRRGVEVTAEITASLTALYRRLAE